MAGRIKRANFESQNILLKLIADSGLSLMMKILICEDNQLASKAMSVVLDREGYETVIASDGNSALDILRNHEFSLVIIDIHLPYHSGLEIIRFLRTDLKKKTPVLIVTAFSDPQMQRQANEMKVSGYITKPFNPDDLIMKIRSLINE